MGYYAGCKNCPWCHRPNHQFEDRNTKHVKTVVDPKREHELHPVALKCAMLAERTNENANPAWSSVGVDTSKILEELEAKADELSKKMKDGYDKPTQTYTTRRRLLSPQFR